MYIALTDARDERADFALCLTSKEADLLDKMLNSIDSYHSEYEDMVDAIHNLIKTKGNLVRD